MDAIPQPLGGNEGSLVIDRGDARLTGVESMGAGESVGDVLYQSGANSRLWRTDMTVWRSADDGASWEQFLSLDPGMSGYSSLQVRTDFFGPRGLAFTV